MKERNTLQPIINAWIGNPFATSQRARDAARRVMVRLDVGAALRPLVARGAGGIAQAKLAVLAYGHAQAHANPGNPNAVLSATAVPREIARKLPRPLSDYRRIATAAARCSLSLASLRGESTAMNELRHAVWAACFGESLRHALDLERVIRDHDVLVLGETGTGKESVAHAIQAATPGGRSGGPAPGAAINAAAIPDTLVESELFGHVKGAFTGATEARSGRIRTSHNGCFFLDEVGDLPFTTQVKLLRVIETNAVYPVGSDAPHTVDVRYVAATHKDLAAMVEQGRFRGDLFQRLAGNVIRIPPLRERPEDIADIGRAFIESYLPETVRDEHMDTMSKWLQSDVAREYQWPGNVRELQNALRNLLLGLPAGIAQTAAVAPLRDQSPTVPAPIRAGTATMKTVTEWYLDRVLSVGGGNLTRAANTLGIDRSTVRRRVKR